MICWRNHLFGKKPEIILGSEEIHLLCREVALMAGFLPRKWRMLQINQIDRVFYGYPVRLKGMFEDRGFTREYAVALLAKCGKVYYVSYANKLTSINELLAELAGRGIESASSAIL
jgi:hypothetical protein